MPLDCGITVKLNYTLHHPYTDVDTVYYEFYEAYLRKLSGINYKVLEHTYEKDDNNVVHLHGIVRMPKHITTTYGPAWDQRYQHLRLPGVHLDIRKITSNAAIKAYIYKDKINGHWFRPGVDIKPSILGPMILRAWEYYDTLVDIEINTMLARRGPSFWLERYLKDDQITFDLKLTELNHSGLVC